MGLTAGKRWIGIARIDLARKAIVGGCHAWQIGFAAEGRAIFGQFVDRARILDELSPGNRCTVWGRFSTLADAQALMDIDCVLPLDELQFKASELGEEYVAEHAAGIVQEFDRLADLIATPELRLFFDRVFRIEDVRHHYFLAPASRQNHHAFGGGLAVHSVETALLFLHQWDCTAESDPEDRDVGIVVTLLHDLGKIAPHLAGEDDLPRSDHEAVTIHLIRPALARLAAQAPSLADKLRYQLREHRFVSGESGWLRHCIRFADQGSACQNNEQVARLEQVRAGEHLALRTNGPRRVYHCPKHGRWPG